MSACFHLPTVTCDNCRPRTYPVVPETVTIPFFQQSPEMVTELRRIADALERLLAPAPKRKPKKRRKSK